MRAQGTEMLVECQRGLDVLPFTRSEHMFENIEMAKWMSTTFMLWAVMLCGVRRWVMAR